MLKDWERAHPGRVESIFNAMGDVVPAHRLDRKLQDFGTVRTQGDAVAAGDLAFDVDGGLEAAVVALAVAAPTLRIAPWRERRAAAARRLR